MCTHLTCSGTIIHVATTTDVLCMPDTVTHFVLDRLTTTEYKQRRKTEFSPVTIKISDGVTNLCKYTY